MNILLAALTVIFVEGHLIGVHHIRELEPVDDGCIIHQYYNPPMVKVSLKCVDIQAIIDYTKENS